MDIIEQWKDDDELFEVMREDLFPAVVGDIMDKKNLLHQFLSPQIQPLTDKMVVVGRAMPVLEADTFEEISKVSHNTLMKKQFGLMLEALDDIRKNEVYICTGASPSYAVWGELMSTRAKILGGNGAVVNGYSRDTKGIIKLDFPTFSLGRYAQDQAPRGKVIDYRVPIEMNGVRINPGDIIFGDLDGVCVIPKEFETDIIIKALEKVRGEKIAQKALEKGMSAVDSFREHGVM